MYKKWHTNFGRKYVSPRRRDRPIKIYTDRVWRLVPQFLRCFNQTWCTVHLSDYWSAPARSNYFSIYNINFLDLRFRLRFQFTNPWKGHHKACNFVFYSRTNKHWLLHHVAASNQFFIYGNYYLIQKWSAHT